MKIIYTCPECGHDLVDLMLTTYPPKAQKKCFNCGWEWTEQQQKEETIRIPFDKNVHKVTTFKANTLESPCDNCSVNLKNGGNGICNCTLSALKINC